LIGETLIYSAWQDVLPKPSRSKRQGICVHMRCLALIGFAAALAGSATLAGAQQGAALKSGAGAEVAPLAVVELFTSQGCSSCPEADALLGRLAGRDDVLALSYPVDYWDYLGWKDTLASPKFTERQKAYKGTLSVPMVYTPMMVVNGLTHVNGRDEDKVVGALEKSNIVVAARVAMRMSEKDGHLVIEAGAAGPSGVPAKDATLWLAVIAKTVAVPIKRGENRGRTITYYNVVRELIPVGMWSGHPVTVQLDRQSVARPGAERYAVLLQQGRGGPIIGAAQLSEF
jgi:hypothetical protein